jgi:hypothetical protein
VLVHGAPDPRPSRILRDYLSSKRLIIDLLSALCMPLEVFAWPPLALLSGVRVFYIWRLTTKVEKTTKLKPAGVRAVRLLVLIAPAFHWHVDMDQTLGCARVFSLPTPRSITLQAHLRRHVPNDAPWRMERVLL